MLYPKKSEATLSSALFMNPTSEYRGAPFWAWNCKLDIHALLKQIDVLKDMGFGGFHIHSRTGMAIPYLSDEFMEYVRMCNDKAQTNQMLCWLYDEDRWGSGFAGGFVTKDIRNRARYIVFTPEVFDNTGMASSREEFNRVVDDNGNPKGYFIASYEIALKDGRLHAYRRLLGNEDVGTHAVVWRAYLEIEKDDPWFNNQAYVNTLDPAAIKKFIEITHERYYSKLANDFGGSIPAIFTDEPHFTRKEDLRNAGEARGVVMPFTDDFNDTYKQAYGDELLDFLPELFWELPRGQVSVARYRYYDHLSERFATAFSDMIGMWCEVHGIMLTGHVLEEPALFSQTRVVGEAMRAYRSFQLPGIDMLCDNREYSTAKQAQSVARQYDRAGVLSELYGVTNWDFSFAGYKLQGDWQAALGVTVRVPHLAWVSMEGEAKRDFPASIGYQSPWYREFRLIEDYFSRLNTVLTRGKSRVRIGVIHPIESHWLCCGPIDQTFLEREELENNFNDIVKWLTFGLLDFDFISESLLPTLCPANVSRTFKVGAMEYDIILVPGCRTLRTTTVERLESFVQSGGRVVFMGEPAHLLDAKASDRVRELALQCVAIPVTKNSLLTSLDEFRDVDIRLENGERSDNLLYQMRCDGDGRWLFICHSEDKRPREESVGYPFMETIEIRVNGVWNPTLYNPMNGNIGACPAVSDQNDTLIACEISIHDSILLHLEPGAPSWRTDNVEQAELDRIQESIEIMDPVAITLSEPNALLLDMAEYSIAGGEWESEEEILRIDRLFREKLGYLLRTDAIPQPWVNPSTDSHSHQLALRFTFHSSVDVKSPLLALENPEVTQIMMNGVCIPSKVIGWYVDESIKTIALPDILAGKSEIVLTIPFGTTTNVEWCYLLGDFGVRVDGRHKRIIDPVRTIAFGDWTVQGLPFYTGNLVYHCAIMSQGERLVLEATNFTNPLLSVSLNGTEKGKIAFAPFTLDLGYVENGVHTLEITAYGHRFNAFGCVHNSDPEFRWFGPNAWRTSGYCWSYQYQLKPMGVMASPRILR